MTDDAFPPESPVKEPIFSAPPLALLLPALLISLYALQAMASPEAQDNIIAGFALSPLLLRQGNYDLLITHMFLHGSWMHVLANSAFCLAFATPVIRAFGKGAGAAASYLSFFLICGVAAGLGYCLLAWQSPVQVVGASGAISGLVGAAIRLRSDANDPDIKSLLHPRVVAMTLTWCGINALTALLPNLFGEGARIAWQAHIVGYFVGLVLISPWMRLFHRGYFTNN